MHFDNTKCMHFDNTKCKKLFTIVTCVLDRGIAEAMIKVDKIQYELKELAEKEDIEKLRVEQKYYGLRKPIFQSRSQLTMKIPNFWSTVLFNDKFYVGWFTKLDRDVMHQFLTNIEVEETKELSAYEQIMKGYKISFVSFKNFFVNLLRKSILKYLGMNMVMEFPD